MPNESDDRLEVERLTKHITLLEKALRDERASKKIAEQKLDDIYQHRYDSYRELVSALEQANHRQAQLQVLSNLANYHVSYNSTAEMLTHFLQEISLLLEDASVILFDFKTPEQAISYKLDKENNNLVKLLPKRTDISSLYSLVGGNESQWQRITEKLTHNHEISAFLEHDFQLVFTYHRLRNRVNLVIIDIPHYCYSKELKQTLDTAGQQFVSALQKRSTEEKLANNYEKLQHTLKKLTSMQNQLVHSEKMASIGQLAAGIAHEINNPIGYVKSNLSVLNDYILLFNQAIKEVGNHLPENEELTFAQQDIGPLIESCIGGVDRVAEIVSSLNSFSRKEESTELQPVSIKDIINDSIKIAWNNIKYNSEIDLKCTEDLPKIMGHKGELQQVLINLIVNAVHSLEEQGKITIKAWANKRRVYISVSDNGCGMDEKTKNKLFEPFFTTKPEGQGTGLGLSVSYAIIEHHKGEIKVESTQGEGTTFELCFPIANESIAIA
ncbi:GHKL domain-containing protein [Thalassotalea sp. M1531]|uniref:histidine kinase n=1 Tax=Thalassotalea algicola TaxID=2716224 RepID=A0A7Y0Q740_9GAMM|nr:ATP-binding protein [Thalassotalea algicola]NMP32088.1 GHKL domain-containing protein [Thalassotalea algicola]